MWGSRHGRRAGRERFFAASLVALALALGPSAGSALANAPIAGFSATPNPVVIHGTVLFDAREELTTNLWGGFGGGHKKLGSTDDGTITSYAWDLDDDGAFDDGTGNTATRQFDTLGSYEVHLRVGDNEGLYDDETMTIVVTTVPPTAVLSFGPTAPFSFDSVTFDASNSTDPDDGIDTYDWDFNGDGTFDATTSTATTTHAYPTPGGHYVVVRVTDASGATDTDSVTVNVGNLVPSANFAAASVAEAGDSVALDATGSDDLDGTIEHYRWDFNGDGIFDADLASPTFAHTFPANGTYHVKLRVVDDFGATSDTTHTIVVTGAPTAAFAILTDPAIAGSPVSFDASSSFDSDGTVARYDWDLDGNGSYETNTGASPFATKTYPNTGTVVVRVRVTDDQGGQGTSSHALAIKPAPDTTGGGSGGSGSDPGGSGSGGSSGSGGGSSGVDGTDADEPGAAGDEVVASLSGTSIQKLRPVLRKGLAMGCRSDRAVRCELVLQIGKRTIGRAVVTLKKAGSKTLKIKLSAKARRLLKRTRSAQVIVRGSATDAKGRTASLRRAFLIRR